MAMKVLFVTSECTPFAKTGGLADVMGSLPKVLAARGHTVEVILPRYRQVPAGQVVMKGLEVRLGEKKYSVDIQKGPRRAGVRHTFVNSRPHFDRYGLYQADGQDYPDNAERFTLFNKAVLEYLRRIRPPDIVHCHDWQTAVLPVLMKTSPLTPRRRRIPVILTVHNLGYQGLFPGELYPQLGLSPELFAFGGFEFWGQINFLKGGLQHADFITTVSPQYAAEIQTEAYGHGLDGVMRHRREHLVGILNGVDYEEWNPETDRHLAANYSASDMAGKDVCRADLFRRFDLPAETRRKPVIGMVARLAIQKGMGLIAEAADELMRENLILVVVGMGDFVYEGLFRHLAQAYPGRCVVNVGYNEPLAHKVEAGADMFLMPSLYEPCGLNQIYSMKYGTVPIVRATGGLEETVEQYHPQKGTGTGFKFADFSGEAMLKSVRAACRLFRTKPQVWRGLMLRGMKKDFSWEVSARAYEALYLRATDRAGKVVPRRRR